MSDLTYIAPLNTQATPLLLSDLLLSQDRTGDNLMLIIGAIWVIVIFDEQLATQCMGLIFQIPDKVFAWVGSTFGSNVGADLENSTGGQVKGMLGTAANTVASGTTEGLQMASNGAGAWRRDRDEKNKDKALENIIRKASTKPSISYRKLRK